MMHGLVTIVLMIGFGSITYWAWSARQRPTFEEAAMRPLTDEDQQEPRS